MHTKLLFNKIENWCRNGLNYRYNAHAAPVSFYQSIPDNLIKGLREQFSVKSEIEEYVEHSVQRLPQTRIFVQNFITPSLRLRSIEYFKHTLLLINPLRDKGPLTLRLRIADGLRLNGDVDIVNVTDQEYKIVCNKPLLIWLFPKKEKREISDINKFLTKILEQEYRLHPLHQMRLSDGAEMESIDRLWATLRSVGPEREIIMPEDRRGWTDNFIWLQEIYLHFGWYAELENIYAEFSDNEFEESSLKKCRQRFRMVCAGESFKTTFEESELKFLDMYLANSVDNASLQDFWQHMHYPAYGFQLKKNMAARPAQYIAFALLALQQQFFWFSKLNTLLSGFLPRQMSGAAGLLLKLKQSTPYYPGSRYLAFNPYNFSGSVQEIRTADQAAVLSLVRQNKRVFTKLQFESEVQFSIDRLVQYHFSISDKKLTVNPVLFRPPLAAPVLEMILIQIDSFSVELPLSWRKFEVILNRVRLKFLRKKDRFQVSIRGKKYTDAIHINQQKIEAVSGHYPVFYIPVSKTESRTEAALFNEWGAFPNAYKSAFIHGWSFDSFQHLQEQAQISVAGQKKSHLLTINVNRAENEKTVESGRELRLNNRYSTGYLLKPKTMDGYLASFLYTDAALLQNRCIIYSAKNPKEIAELFYTAMGFYPAVRALDDICPMENVFVIIVAERFNGEVATESEGYKIISLFSDSRQKGMLINQKSIKNVLKAHFNRNKFDFNNQF